MPVFKKHTHDTQFTIIDNHLLRDMNLSLKTIGLLAKVLSLPEEWDFSEEGLAAICKDGRSAIHTALKEMEDNGYLIRTQIRDNQGHYSDVIYDFYETPHSYNPDAENPVLDKPHNKVKRENYIFSNKVMKDKVNKETRSTELNSFLKESEWIF